MKTIILSDIHISQTKTAKERYKIKSRMKRICKRIKEGKINLFSPLPLWNKKQIKDEDIL